MFRQFFDTSFNDYRQVRVIVQELRYDPLKEPSIDFQRFCTNFFNHKTFTYEPFKLEYCFVKESLTIEEATLNEIQLYRRPFAFIFYAVCQTSDELRFILNKFAEIKQREKNVYIHLFVQYKNTDSKEEDETFALDNASNGDSDCIISSRPSVSSMVSVDSYHSLPPAITSLKLQDSISIERSGSITSDSISLTSSLNDATGFQAIGGDTQDDLDASTASIEIVKKPAYSHSKKFKAPFFKSLTLPTANIFDQFESDISRVSNYLENNLAKLALDSKRPTDLISSIGSQLADMRLMIDSEKNCTLLENHGKDHPEYNHRVFKLVIEEFDIRIMQALLHHYSKATTILNMESTKNKLAKKLIDSRTIKRKGDCCLLLGSVEKAGEYYRRAAETLKSHNDSVWYAAALEARVAVSYSSTRKPKSRFRHSKSYFSQSSLNKTPSLQKLLKLSHKLLNLQSDIELAIQNYSTAHSSSFDNKAFRLQLDACLRWCSLLLEQNDLKKYRADIDEYIKRIDVLGFDLKQYIDTIYLNAYLAETYATIGLKRKSALYYRSAAFLGLTLLTEQKDYLDEINFFEDLIKQARTGYGIDDNQLNFPLIQKTIINESIQISFKNNNFTTIIENVHFAIETLIEYMTDDELKLLLTFLNASNQAVACSYCSIPRLKSLDLLPLSDRLKAWEPKATLFIYTPIRSSANLQQSLHRKVDFFWVKNEHAQIALVVENYLPSAMSMHQLEFISDKQLSTTLETKYRIPSRTTKRLLIDCIPKETGQYRIQGLRYHIMSTNQEFQFKDFPTIRQCACAIEVVDELPILDIEYLLVNNTKIDLLDKSTIYNAQVHRGEDLFVTLGLINSSSECDINTMKIEAFVFGSDMTKYIKIAQFDLPILIGNTIKPTIDLTEIYDRCLSRQDRSNSQIECLTIELRVNYSNGLSMTIGYGRRQIFELRLDYFSSVMLDINDIQNDEDDTSYLIYCTIENHLSEGIQFENNTVNSSESSLITIKQEKIKLNTFPSNLNQFITDIRTQLPTHIHYKTITSEKHFRSPIDWQNFSNDKIQNHFSDLIQSPYICTWRFERMANTLHICLSVLSRFYKISKLEFIFPSSHGNRFLNSNKIIFNDIEPGEYYMAERILIFSQDNNSDVLVVDVSVNDIVWKRITLTF